MTYFQDAVNVVERPILLGDHDQNRFWRLGDVSLAPDAYVVTGGMFPAQREWWCLGDDVFVRGFIGGYGAGKTHIGGKRIISLALENAPVPVAAVSPTFPMARTTMIATISELLQGKQSILGQKLSWKYNQQYHEFIINYAGRTGKILVYSGERPLSLRGPNLAAAWLDEPFIMDVEVFNQMIARIRHPLAKRKELSLTGTPEQLNWGYDLFAGNLKEKFKPGLVVASTRQNLTLDAGYVGRLEASLSEKACMAYIDGQFVNLQEGLIYYGFNPAVNIKEIPRPDGAELGCGMDFNVNPFAFCVFWKRGDHMHYIDEFELVDADTELAMSKLREKYPELRKIYPDASGSHRHTSSPTGRSDFTFIREAGYDIFAKSQNPKVRDRINAVNGKLKPRSGSITLTIDPKCEKLKKYLQQASNEQQNQTLQIKMGHLLDAFSYPVAYLFPADRETLTVSRLYGA